MPKLAAAALVLALATPAQAQAADDFYAGKQIRIVVGTTTGGDYDLWARLLARHIGRHIPGNPTVIVENMPGAGTLLATNHLFNVAPRDGTVIGMISRSMPAAAVMKVRNVRFDPVKFNWLGSPGGQSPRPLHQQFVRDQNACPICSSTS